MKTADIYTIDANIILRYLTHDQEDHFAKAAAILEAVQDDKVEVYCEPVTLAEVVWVLAKVYGLSPQQITTGLSPIVASRSFKMPDKPRYLRALELYASDLPHFGDACACAAALDVSDGKLLSFDKDLSSVQGISRLETVTPSR